ncbi:MAG: DegT/DnrJ/EryC1/StrS family aminotransferase [Solirubrobacterales bacterium]
MNAVRSLATTSEVPFVDLGRHHDPTGEELRLAFDRMLSSGGFILGAEVDRFEAEFAAFCGTRHCVGTASGTAALMLALLAAGIEPGDEVIVPAHTYVATPLAVLHARGTPVFCDVEDDTGLIDVRSAADAVSSRTAAIIPVHLYGQLCDMDAVAALAREHSFIVVEDAAQAHGARGATGRAGSLGDVSAFSFYPSKNLGALGDGGAVCTDDDEIASRVRRLRNLGQRRKGEHLEVGFNERLDGLQAAMLRVKLQGLERGNAARRALAALYRQMLPEGCSSLPEDGDRACVYHLFPVRVARRDEVRASLHQRGVRTGVHYWPAAHRQPAVADGRAPSIELSAAVRWSEEELSLPMFAELTADEVMRVTNALADALAEGNG